MFDDKMKRKFQRLKSQGEDAKAYSVTKNTFIEKERMYYEKGNEQQRFLTR